MQLATQRLMASVDDLGDVAVMSGATISIGHRAAGSADLEFMGGIADEHALVVLEQSFHGGLVWTLRLHPGSPPATVNGRELGVGEPHSFSDGDEIYLGAAANFRVRQPNLSSASVVLELLRQTELDGARRVLLLAPGPSAHARIGPRSNCHLLVPGLKADIEILRASKMGSSEVGSTETGNGEVPIDVLLLRCSAGVRSAGSPADGATEWSTPLPLQERVILSSGADPGRLPPLGIALRPLTG